MPLRFGVVVSGTRMPAWQAGVVTSLRAWPGAELALVLTAPDRPAGSRAWRAMDLVRGRGKAKAFRIRDASEELRGVQIQSAGLGGAGAPSAAAVDAIAAADLDVLVDLGPRAWTGAALEAPRHGVWAFEHGNGDRGAPGLAELLADAPCTAVRLVRVREGGVDVLHEGSFPTAEMSWAEQLDRLLLGANGWVVRAAKELASGGIEGPRGVPARAGGPASARDALALPPRLIRGAVRRQVEGFTKRAQWGVGLLDLPLEALTEDATTAGARWLRPPEREGYVADPFGLRVGEKTYILAEHYGFSERHGRIVVMESRGGGPLGDPQVVIDEAVHLSYPYLLEVDGEIYCVPERSAAREVALYRAIAFPRRWERLFTLVDGIAAADASLFQHEGRWWLLCTNADAEPAIDLHAFWADELAGPWHPHALNPLKTDISGSRPAGTPFVVDDALYRPAQDCSETYGGAVAIFAVEELTPHRFRERRVATLRPDPKGPFPAGVHTVSRLGDATLIDGKRWVLSRAHVREQLRRKLRRRP